MKRFFVATLMTLGLAMGLPSVAAEKAVIESTLARAAAVHDQALALEHGWSVTQPFIDEARAALEAGDFEAASQAAERALLTAEKSLEQAQVEALAWQDRVLGS